MTGCWFFSYTITEYDETPPEIMGILKHEGAICSKSITLFAASQAVLKARSSILPHEVIIKGNRALCHCRRIMKIYRQINQFLDSLSKNYDQLSVWTYLPKCRENATRRWLLPRDNMKFLLMKKKPRCSSIFFNLTVKI